MHCCNSPLEGLGSLFPVWGLGQGSKEKKKKVNVTVLLFFSQIHCLIYHVYDKYMKIKSIFLSNSAEVCRV